ncbi:MAG: CHRD domain-containing protein [Salinibacterium sp.]|nr:CHRD domain-containing protein [Salinibacterium sp.]
MYRNKIMTAAIVALLASLGAGLHAQTSFAFTLGGSQEVPAVTTTAQGVGFATLDGSNNLTLSVQHSVAGATAAHIHFATAGSNGGVVYNLGSPASPINFSMALNATDVANLNAGAWYVNVHSAAFPGGEIRGQIINGFQEQVFISEYCNDPFGAATGLDTNLDGVAATSGAQQEDEFVEIVNGTSQTVNISGWTLADAVAVRHTFVTGTMLPPGSAIVVFGGGDVTAFNAAGLAGVVADQGQLGLNNTSDTITLSDGSANIIDQYSFTSGGPDDGDGESVTRDPEIAGATFEFHSLLAAGALHSAGFHNDTVFPYPAAILPAPPTVAYAGNGSDCAISIFINGAPSTPANNVHSAAAGDLVSMRFLSPGGSLDGTPFLGLAQLFTTGMPTAPLLLPGDAVASVYLDLAGPITVLANGLANPGTLFSPVLGSYTVVGFLPPALSGLNLSTMIVNLASDPGFNPVNLGVADSHEIQVN